MGATSAGQVGLELALDDNNVEAQVKKILESTEKTAKSKAASISQIYKKQGMDASDAMKKAWKQIERGGIEAEKASRKISLFGKRSVFSANESVTAYNGLNNIFERLNSSFKRMLMGAFTVFGSKLLADFGKQCIELGSDLAEVQNVVDVTFTTMSAKVDKFTQNAAKQFGLSETMAKRYTGTFGAMAKAFGFSEKQAYDMSTALTGLAGDVASFYNIGQDEAYTKLKSVFTGETESLKDLGVVMTQTALDQYAMQNGFGKTTKAMSEQEKVALRYAFVQSQLNTAAGDFSRTSGSWANQVRLLTLQFESLKASIGQGLIAAFTPAIRAVNIFIGRILTAINTVKALFASFGKAGQIVGGVADKFKKFTGNTDKASMSTKGLSGAGDDAAMSMQSLGSGADSAGKKATKASKKAGDAAKKAAKKIRSLMGFDQINKVDKKEKTGNSGSGGVGGGGAGSGGVGGGATDAGLSDMDSGMEKTSKKSLKLGKIWKNLLEPVARLKKAFAEFWGIMKSAGKWVWDNILVPLGKWTISELAPKLIDVLAGAFRVLSKILKALAPIWQKLWDVFFKPIAKWTGDVIITALDLLTKALNGIADFGEKHPKIFQAIVAGLMGFLIFKKLGGTLGILTKLLGFVSRIQTLIMAHPIAAILIGIAAAAFLIYKNWDKIKKTKFGKALIKAGQALKKFGTYLAGTFKKTVEKILALIEGFKKAWEAIKDKKAELTAEAKEKIEGALAAISGAWESIKDRVAELKAKAAEATSGALESLKTKWESIKSKTAELTAKIITSFSDLVKEIEGKAVNFVAQLNSWKESLKDKVINFVSKLTSFKDELKDKIIGFKAKMNSWGDYLKDKIIGFKAKMNSWSDSLKNKIIDFKSKISSFINNIALKNRYLSFKAKITGFIDNIKNKAISGFKAVFGKKASGGIYKNGRWSPVQKYAAGGSPDKGQMFIAREAGPELVGTLGGHTAVMNNDQIVASVSAGVAKAVSSAMTKVGQSLYNAISSLKIETRLPEIKANATPQLKNIGTTRDARDMAEIINLLKTLQGGNRDGEMITLLRQMIILIDKVSNRPIYLDGKDVTDKVVKRINDTTKSTGNSPILI